MARPTQRPTKPYTNQEIIDRVRQHFITEGNPKCVYSTATGVGVCVYGRTGCAVGCLMTQEDSDFLDSENSFLPVEDMLAYYSDIYNAYFTKEQVNFLSDLQEWHDSTNKNEFSVDLLNTIEAKYV